MGRLVTLYKSTSQTVTWELRKITVSITVMTVIGGMMYLVSESHIYLVHLNSITVMSVIDAMYVSTEISEIRHYR
jgi:hypothetical protein